MIRITQILIFLLVLSLIGNAYFVFVNQEQKPGQRVVVSSSDIESDYEFLTDLKSEFSKASQGTFWKMPVAQDIASAPKLLRERVIEKYGDAAKSHPLFARYFRPFDEVLPQFSTAKQVNIHDVEAEMRGRQNQVIRDKGRLAPGDLVHLEAEKKEKLIQFLSDEEYFEYSLRYSQLAQRMKATALEFTEDRIRSVFEILSVADMDLFSPRPRVEDGVRQSVSNVLGEERTVELLARLSPRMSLPPNMNRSSKEGEIMESLLNRTGQNRT